MAEKPTTCLHQVNSGIQDVLKGYETLKERAEPAIAGIVDDLDAMHRRHAAEIGARLVAYGENADDATLRGTFNQALTTVRDWVGDMGEDALSFIRTGEQRMLDVYDAALAAWEAHDAPKDREIVVAQADELRGRVETLPKA